MVELFPLAKLISFLYVPMYASVYTLWSELQSIIQKSVKISFKDLTFAYIIFFEVHKFI